MDLKRKQIIASILEKKIKEAQTRAGKTLKTAKIFRRASRSQQGDRLYFQNAASLAEDHLIDLIELKKELASASSQPLPVAQPVSFITIEDDNGETSSFYFVQKGVQLPGLPLLTPESPLGKSIYGKKPGEKFSYRVEKENQSVSFSGKIKKIE